MATRDRKSVSVPEAFQVHLHRVVCEDEFVDVREFSRAEEALAMAFQWSNRGLPERAEVWVGPWQIFDSFRFDPMTLKHRCAPLSPGRYFAYFLPDGDFEWRLVSSESKQGPGR